MQFVAILYNIRSLHNVGSIFRTADGAGVSKIYCVGITPTPLDRFGRARPQFAKVSLGAERHVSWEHIHSFPALLKRIKKDKYSVIALEQHSSSASIFKFKSKNKRIALIVGNEVKGIPTGVLKKADEIIEIPMRGKKESLNVSVAFGIAVYTIMK